MNNYGNFKQLSNEEVLQVSGGNAGGANPPPFIDCPDPLPGPVCFTRPDGTRVCVVLPPAP
jgi:hypothetical protein